MAKTKKRPRGVNPNDLTTAQAEAEQKYGPQSRQIQGLIAQAADQYASDVESAKNAAESGKAYALGAIPNVQKTYSGALSQADEDNAFIGGELAKLGAAADVFKGANVKAQGSAHDRIIAAGAEAEQGLRDRATAAQAGGQFARNQARADYRKALAQLASQSQALTGDLGSYITARLGALRNERLNRKTKLDIAGGRVTTSGPFAGLTDAEITALTPEQRQAQIDAYNAAKGGGAKTKRDRRTAVQRQGLSDDFQSALRHAQDYASQQRPRADAADDLLRGRIAGTDPQTGETWEAIPSFKQLPLTLALDMAYDGKISKANARKLHALGYKVSDLTGAISYSDWLARSRPKGKRPSPGGRQGELGSRYGWGQ